MRFRLRNDAVSDLIKIVDRDLQKRNQEKRFFLKRWLEQLEALFNTHYNSDLYVECKIITRIRQPYWRSNGRFTRELEVKMFTIQSISHPFKTVPIKYVTPWKMLILTRKARCKCCIVTCKNHWNQPITAQSPNYAQELDTKTR